MATLEDLNIKPISEMSVEEAIEHLRQIRLSRRIPVKKTKSKTKAKKAPKKLPKPTAEDAAELLKLLGG